VIKPKDDAMENEEKNIESYDVFIDDFQNEYSIKYDRNDWTLGDIMSRSDFYKFDWSNHTGCIKTQGRWAMTSILYKLPDGTIGTNCFEGAEVIRPQAVIMRKPLTD